MSFLRLDDLPFVGMSHEFVGETQGAPFSAYIVSADPGKGPPLHTHPKSRSRSKAKQRLPSGTKRERSLAVASSSYPQTRRIVL